MGNKTNEENFSFGDLKKFLVKEKPKEKPKRILKPKRTEPKTIICEICEENIPSNFFEDHYIKCQAKEEIAEKIAEEVGIQSEIKDIIDKIEKIEINWDLEIMQKLITVKNVLNYSQSAWSLGVCNEILGEGSIRGSHKKIGYGLMKTIKKICKLR